METLNTTSLETITTRQKEIVSLLLKKGFAIQPLRPEEEWTVEILLSIIAGEMVRHGYLPKSPMATADVDERDFVIIRHVPRVIGGVDLINSLRRKVPVLVTGLPEELREVGLGSEMFSLLPVEIPVEERIKDVVAQLVVKANYGREERKLLRLVSLAGALGTCLHFDHLADAMRTNPEKVGTIVEELHQQQLLMWSEEGLRLCGGEVVARKLLEGLGLTAERAILVLLRLTATVEEKPDRRAMSQIFRVLAVNPAMREKILGNRDILELRLMVEIFWDKIGDSSPPLIFEGV